MRNVAVGQSTRTRVAAGEVYGSPSRVDSGNVAAEEIEAVTKNWASNLIARFNDVPVILLWNVIFGCAIQTLRRRQGRQSRIESLSANDAPAVRGHGYVSAIGGSKAAGTRIVGIQSGGLEVGLEFSVPLV